MDRDHATDGHRGFRKLKSRLPTNKYPSLSTPQPAPFRRGCALAKALFSIGYLGNDENPGTPVGVCMIVCMAPTIPLPDARSFATLVTDVRPGRLSPDAEATARNDSGGVRDLGHYVRPNTLSDAVAALQARPGMRILAGGTDVYPMLGDAVRDADLLDITGVSGLREITSGPEGIRIGALATWTDVQRADLGSGFRALQEAGREVGSPQIQNAATVAGNVCNASPAADGTAALLALGAEVEVVGPAGTRRVALADFVTGVRQVALAPAEIVSALHLPPHAGLSAFVKLGARKYLVISIAMVAAHVARDAQGRIARAAVAVGSCAPVARRQRALEAALIGARADDLADAVRPDLLEG
ncbi:MAG: CO or xanthine dehydrogenase, FAD-binding subunit, partial [Rhodobacteraceae bacterium HLUCCA24]